MSLQIIQKLNANGIKCVTLTKGISPFELSKCSKENEYGITLVSLDEDFRQRMEPYTTPYEELIYLTDQLIDCCHFDFPHFYYLLQVPQISH